jgi:uncharacterized metal-binding protein
MSSNKSELPLVYSCSGCSSAAQMANYVALQLDRQGAAEMSCIAGVGGDVPHLLKIAQSGRPVIALDGCVLACTKSCLARHDIVPDSYHLLSDYGVKKRYHADFDRQEADAVVARVAASLLLAKTA